MFTIAHELRTPTRGITTRVSGRQQGRDRSRRPLPQVGLRPASGPHRSSGEMLRQTSPLVKWTGRFRRQRWIPRATIMHSEHVCELLAARGWLRSKAEDWIVVVGPDLPGELWVHKPFAMQLGLTPLVLSCLAIQLLDTLPAGQRYGELVGDVPPQSHQIDDETVEIKTPLRYNLGVLPGPTNRYCVYAPPPPTQMRVTPFCGDGQGRGGAQHHDHHRGGGCWLPPVSA